MDLSSGTHDVPSISVFRFDAYQLLLLVAPRHRPYRCFVVTNTLSGFCWCTARNFRLDDVSVTFAPSGSQIGSVTSESFVGETIVMYQ